MVGEGFEVERNKLKLALAENASASEPKEETALGESSHPSKPAARCLDYLRPSAPTFSCCSSICIYSIYSSIPMGCIARQCSAWLPQPLQRPNSGKRNCSHVIMRPGPSMYDLPWPGRANTINPCISRGI